jgi:hypothetical protein
MSACLLGGCATLDNGKAASELSFGCNDLVVIGRITTITGTGITDVGDLPNWYSRWQLRIKIKRVVRGSEKRRIVPATAISHAQIRGDRDFLAVLGPADNGAYVLKTGALWGEKPRPHLAKSCD